MKMNWYKTAKLADKDPNPDKLLFTACMYCNRWKTDESPPWKTFEQLSSEEDKYQAARALESMKDSPEDIGISHGICSYCHSLMPDGLPKNNKETRELIKNSLLMA